MRKIVYPPADRWASLTTRPVADRKELDGVVREIFEAVRLKGDEAVRYYTEVFDNVKLPGLSVDRSEIDNSVLNVAPELREAIELAKSNIEKFHRIQPEKGTIVETSRGVFCRTESRPIGRVGLYIPGGTAPLFSTVLMLAIPARLAGCSEIVLCTPPDKDGKINPVILYAARIAGINAIFRVGGVQAIAAMAIGTESIPAVYKLFGPGNRFVTAAKLEAMKYGVSIDMPAGPSELLVIADETSKPGFVAADLLSQAEHGVDSQVMLLSDNERVVDTVMMSVREQLPGLPRQTVAEASLENSRAIVLRSKEECLAFSNLYAPEHLIIATDDAADMASGVVNAGSVFLGHFSPESAGDYASGTNHTLPTDAFARSYSGVSTASFTKRITFQEITAEGVRSIGKAVTVMAEAEGLRAHADAMSQRIKYLENERSV